MLATTGRWKIGFKKLENLVPKEREATLSCLTNFNGTMNGSVKVIPFMKVMMVILLGATWMKLSVRRKVSKVDTSLGLLLHMQVLALPLVG